MKPNNKIKSICPECKSEIIAQIFERNDNLVLKKMCYIHGEFEDIYYGNPDLYKKFMNYYEGENSKPVQKNSAREDCPQSCGLCTDHKSNTILANIDITNVCNFHCPICFANSDVTDYFFNPTLDEISAMMDVLRNQNPPCEVVQFSGGEPTIRKDFIPIAKLAREKGFIHVQVATNGKVIAENPDYANQLVDADIDTVYLQFDGITPEPYEAIRGFNALPLKMKVIENMRRAGRRPHIVLVPTVIKGVNDHQIGDIVRFAADNIDIIRGINFQPVAFTGRISNEELLNRRITIPDIINSLKTDLNGQIAEDDFLPVTAFRPIVDFLEAMNINIVYPKLNTHPVCGTWTFVFKDENKLIPLNRIINVEEIIKFIGSLNSPSKSKIAAGIATNIHKLLRKGSIRYASKIGNSIRNFFINRSVEAASQLTNNQDILFIGAMHFMDPYNFDIERLKRCCIHNVTPDGSIIPFCAYNIFYREKKEREFAQKLLK